MLQAQFINIVKESSKVSQQQLSDLELLLNEYPFFATAHLLYTKGLYQNNAINYSKQLRKTAIVASNRAVLYNLLNQELVISNTKNESHADTQVNPVIEKETVAVNQEVVKAYVPPVEVQENNKKEQESVSANLSPVTTTSSDVKVIYVNTVSSSPKPEVNEELAVNKNNEDKKQDFVNEELDIVKKIENVTEAPIVEEEIKKEEQLNKEIELEISKGIVQSYVETDILKTPDLHKEENKEPESFVDWLNRIKKESHTIQPAETPKTEIKAADVEQNQPIKAEDLSKTQAEPKIEKKNTDFEQKKSIIDKIIDADPGRIKLGNTKFFTPSTEAKQSLLENEHLVTETLAKIYALQGNISKAIRAYEILSLKFPQKSVYFASLIEKLKNSK